MLVPLRRPGQAFDYGNSTISRSDLLLALAPMQSNLNLVRMNGVIRRSFNRQYCSKNLTIISLKQLRKNLDIYFEHGASFELPSVQGNPLFPQALPRSFRPKNRVIEFLQTVKLFRAVCSWGTSQIILVSWYLLRNPIIIQSFAILRIWRRPTILLIIQSIRLRKIAASKFVRIWFVARELPNTCKEDLS